MSDTTAIRIRARVAADGVLRVKLPAEFRGQEVEASLQILSAEEATACSLGWPPGFVERTVGAWQGDLERAPQDSRS